MQTSGSVVENYDLVILGSGEGGKYLAWTLAKEGMKVAVVEKKYVGGSCPNIACLPSKNIIHSAKVASLVKRSSEFGIHVDGFQIDAKAVRARKRNMVDSLIDIHLKAYETSGAELIMGKGRFVDATTIEVQLNAGGIRVVRGRDVVIGTGTRARLADVPGLAAAEPWTHIEALEFDTIPEHLIVVGGGYVGLELAQAARRFGSKVTIVERETKLLGKEDSDVTEAVESLLRDEGVELLLDAQLHSVSGRSGDTVTLAVQHKGQQQIITGTHILVAAGRIPNTEDLNAQAYGIQLTAQGYIQVNERLQATAPNVWAIGDVAGGPQFTHLSFDDFRVIRANLAGKDRVTTGRQVPYTMYTDPELAHIGLRENEAVERGIAYRRFKVPMAAVLRSRTLSETRGFLKALVDTNDQLLGFTVFGVDGGEIMGAIQMAMLGGLPYTAIRDAVLTHPTLLEGLIPLFSSAPTQVGG